jgi:hypothetical protein
MQHFVQHFAKNTTAAVRPELVEGWATFHGSIHGSTSSPRTGLKLAEENIGQADV